jgi:hypothetical protein
MKQPRVSGAKHSQYDMDHCTNAMISFLDISPRFRTNYQATWKCEIKSKITHPINHNKAGISPSFGFPSPAELKTPPERVIHEMRYRQLNRF